MHASSGPERACCMCRRRRPVSELLRFAWKDNSLRLVRLAGVALDEPLPTTMADPSGLVPLRAGTPVEPASATALAGSGELARAPRNDDDTAPSGKGDPPAAIGPGAKSPPALGHGSARHASSTAQASSGMRAMSVCPAAHCLSNWLRKMAGRMGPQSSGSGQQIPSNGVLLAWLQQVLAQRRQRRVAGLARRKFEAAQDPVLLRWQMLCEELQRGEPAKAQKRSRNASIPANPAAVRPQPVRP